MLRADWK